MIVLSIAFTWMTLTAGGVVALSALGRAAARNDVAADVALAEDEAVALFDARRAAPASGHAGAVSAARTARGRLAPGGGRRRGHPEVGGIGVRGLDGAR